MEKIDFYALTDPGLKRTINEDKYLIMEKHNLAVIADGMGGGPAGEKAAIFFIECFVDVFKEISNLTVEKFVVLVKKAFATANMRILNHVKKNPRDTGMGCAGIALHIQGNEFVSAHAGDCRLYRLRRNHFQQITMDHSLVQELVKEGILTAEEAHNHPRKNVITRATGIEENLKLDISKGMTVREDKYLICSDGLYDMIDDSSIKDLLISGKEDPGHLCQNLIDAANSAGGKDNITVALCSLKNP